MDDECKAFTDVAPRRILVIKLSSLGDIVHTLPAVAALRTRFPAAHICWIIKSQWASILEENPDIDEVPCIECIDYSGHKRHHIRIWDEIASRDFELILLSERPGLLPDCT